MYNRSPERRRRQKVARPSSFRVENEQNPEDLAQYIQITVNVIEARKLDWANPHTANCFVVAVLGKKKFRSNMRRNMPDPYFNECFVFEMFVSIESLQRSTLWLAVMESRCCASSRLMGEATVDLSTIWAQPRHQVFHKWAQLTLPRDPTAGPVGFLKVDISIIFRGELQVMPAIVSPKPIENNLLLPTGSEQQRANYVITVFGAFGLPSGSHGQGNRRYGKQPSTFVKVSFCGLVVKTAVQHNNNHPLYCEQVSIVEMFPNICQTIRLDVCSSDGCYNRIIASAHLKLGLVSHDGENGFLPTFGPSLLHMYGAAGTSSSSSEDGPYHRGALLVSLKTIVPYYQQGVRNTSVEPVTQIKPENLWIMEDFWIFCPVLEVSMLDCKVAGRAPGVALTIGEVATDCTADDDFAEEMTESRRRKLHYTGNVSVIRPEPTFGYMDFQSGYPVLQLATRLPDFRFRMYRNNMVQEIITDLETSIESVERKLKMVEYSMLNELVEELNKAIDEAAGDIAKFLEIVQYSSASDSDTILRHNMTELDQKQLTLLREEMEKIYHQIVRRNKAGSTLSLIRSVSGTGDFNCNTKKGVKLFLAEVKVILQSLRNLIFKSSEGWPDIAIWLLSSGSRVAYARIPAADVIYSGIPEQGGRNCGKIQSVYLRPIKCLKHVNTCDSECYCVTGKIELLLWMGLFKKKSAFESFVPIGMHLKKLGHEITLKSSVLMLDCRIFIYRAKINNAVDSSINTSSVFSKMNILNEVRETKKIPKTATPVWNQVIKINTLTFSSLERIVESPPLLTVELYEFDFADKLFLIGRTQVKPVLDDRHGPEHVPKLQWYEICRGSETMGQILMSVKLMHIPEKLMKTTSYLNIEDTYNGTDVRDYTEEEEGIDTIPPYLVPQSSSFKVDVYWWGLRDVNIIRKPCVVLEIDELTIKSDVILDKQVNCNFPNGKSSHIFEAPLSEDYSSLLSVRLYDSGTFGRTRFVGTNDEKHPNKYIVNWICQSEREESLRSASITSSDFCQISPSIFKKKFNLSLVENDSSYVFRSRLRSVTKQKAKRSTWDKLFSRKKPNEEEYVLLPIFEKETKHFNLTMKNSSSPLDPKDWWLRYFNSIKEEATNDKSTDRDKIVIYDSELEHQPEFSKFKDWCTSFKFYNGKKTGIPQKDERMYCGILKVGIAIYKWPPPGGTIAVTPSGVDLNNGYFDEFPDNEAASFLVRVYLVKGIDLKKKDFTGQSDPYVLMSCGKKVLGDRNTFVKKNVNPVFGRMYEFRGNLPEDYLLTISLYDYDPIQSDELIGSTCVDLEDRIYSKHRARVGLSSEYNVVDNLNSIQINYISTYQWVWEGGFLSLRMKPSYNCDRTSLRSGPYKWRDCMKPSEILDEMCLKNHLPPPISPDAASIMVNGVEYRDSDREKTYLSTSECRENICLSLLRQWHTLPICGHQLVPEHVETRTLYNPEKPGCEQGKIQLWVDIFPLDADVYIPPPVDITPRNPTHYELRVIVWDVQQLRLDDNITGRKYPDIYVKAWIGSTSQAQDTDIHCKSLNGEGNFNWRMIFDFQYQPVEKKIILKEKDPFTEFEERVQPILVVQVLDTEAVSGDDFIGTLTLNLNSLRRGDKSPNQCTLDSIENAKIVNLFTLRSMRAWWPLWTIDPNSDRKILAGVVDLELTLLPKEKALLMPVGLGRSSPVALPEPHRPRATGFVFKLRTEETYRFRVIKLILIVVFLIFLITSAIYLDLLTPMDDEWISGEPIQKSSEYKTLHPVN